MSDHSSTHHHKNAFVQLLSSTKVSSFPAPASGVITVHSSETPYQGFKKLADHNILSAPVIDDKTHKYTGFLDIRDLVSFVVYIDDDQNSSAPSDLEQLVMHGLKMFKAPVEGVTVTYLSRRNTFHPVSPHDSLLTVCEILSKGLHRVPVVNEKGELINIISQSTIIQFLDKNLSHLGEEAAKSAAQLHLGTSPVLSVLKDQPAIEVFRLMDKRKISGVAVVDAEGTLVGNTSSSDLKLFIRTLSLDILKTDIMHFLNHIRQESIDIKAPTISCKSTDSLAICIGKLASTKVHKLFIADDESGYKAQAVVSITDILRHVLGNLGK